MPEERLQKIIARAGFASRREAESLMQAGKVTVNGKVVTELGTKADSERDHVKVDGKLITRPETKRYILLYKPREIMTTSSDPEGRKTVLDLVKGVRERLFPVGRLDFHSEGLIILTNDGDLAFKVAHPSHGSVKTYHVKVRGVPEERILDKLRRGITIDGRRTMPCEIDRMRTTGKTEDEGNSWFEVRLREGRTQQIRKMYQAVGHPVSKLRRVAIGPVSDSKLGPGDYRELSPQEVQMLYTNPEARSTRASRRTPTSRAATRPPAARATTRSTAPTRKAGSKAANPKRSGASSSTRSKGSAGPRPGARRRNG